MLLLLEAWVLLIIVSMVVCEEKSRTPWNGLGNMLREQAYSVQSGVLVSGLELLVCSLKYSWIVEHTVFLSTLSSKRTVSCQENQSLH